MPHHTLYKADEFEKGLLNKYYILCELVGPNFKYSDAEVVRKAIRLLVLAGQVLPAPVPKSLLMRAIGLAAILVKELDLDMQSVVCAVLYRAVDEKLLTISQAEENFGEETARTIGELIKLEQRPEAMRASHDTRSTSSALVSERDRQCLLIVLVGYLYDMRTLTLLPSSNQTVAALKANSIYVPLAQKLGLYDMKAELEDLYFKHTSQKQYERLQNKVREYTRGYESVLQCFQASLEYELEKTGIDYAFKSRVKGVYSIWRKMKQQKIAFEEVYDLLAVRIIIDAPREEEKKACWQAYTAVTNAYRPHKARTRNWISIPKKTGYEALHTTVMNDDGQWIEVQIRTKRMDFIAERGDAAHWRYKEQGLSSLS
ncbi:MAG: HD domain-containing protein [Bacteroidota bacterium]